MVTRRLFLGAAAKITAALAAGGSILRSEPVQSHADPRWAVGAESKALKFAFTEERGQTPHDVVRAVWAGEPVKATARVYSHAELLEEREVTLLPHSPRNHPSAIARYSCDQDLTFSFPGHDVFVTAITLQIHGWHREADLPIPWSQVLDGNQITFRDAGMFIT